MAENTVGVGIMLGPTNASFDDPGVLAVIKKSKQLIAESIFRILSTNPGERVRNPEFGCAIKKLIFEQNDMVLERAGTFLISSAISKWEPRVKIASITISQTNNPNTIAIKLIFRITDEYDKLFSLVTYTTV